MIRRPVPIVPFSALPRQLVPPSWQQLQQMLGWGSRVRMLRCTPAAGHMRDGYHPMAAGAASRPQPIQPQSSGPSPVEARKEQLLKGRLQSFRIAGVSFDDRQAAVAALQSEDGVQMTREPGNPYDPGAVRVQTLAGAMLGYVPRELTGAFIHDVTFGHVYSVGAATTEHGPVWGAQVAVRPELPALALCAWPANLAGHINLSSELPRRDWQRLELAAIESAARRCQVSGAHPSALRATEVWRFDEDGRVAELQGLTAVHPDVYQAMRIALSAGERQQQQGVWMLQAMNEWVVQEAEAHIRFTRETALRRTSQSPPWRLSLRWLLDQGIATPPALQQLC